MAIDTKPVCRVIIIAQTRARVSVNARALRLHAVNNDIFREFTADTAPYAVCGAAIKERVRVAPKKTNRF